MNLFEAVGLRAGLYFMRNVVIYVNDAELAEIAALGIRLAAGWNVDIVQNLAGLPGVLNSRFVYAILNIALHSSASDLRDLRDLQCMAAAYSTPVVVLTQEPYLFEQLRGCDLLTVCNAFDPLLLSSMITEALESRAAASA